MKIPLKTLDRILQAVRETESYNHRGRDRVLKFAVVEEIAVGKCETDCKMQEVVVYFDYKQGWVLDTQQGVDDE